MRYIEGNGFKRVAVVADSLDGAFDKVAARGVCKTEIFYLNREIEVLE